MTVAELQCDFVIALEVLCLECSSPCKLATRLKTGNWNDKKHQNKQHGDEIGHGRSTWF